MENIGAAATSDPAVGVRVLPAMIARGTGSLVQVASVAALVAPPGQTWYGASKAGLAQSSETLRSELTGTGVHACTVYPGPIKTPMGDAAFAKYGGREGPAGRAPEGTPERLAELILRAVAKKQARVVYPRFFALAY
jgi:short-subunit dehydrogenase